MYLFNVKLLILGSLIAFFLFLSNSLYLFLCCLFKIRVLKFSFFLSPQFSLYSEKIGQTDFILGWIPTTSFVEIFGKSSDIEEQKSIPEEDLPVAFFPKPPLPPCTKITSCPSSVISHSISPVSESLATVPNGTSRYSSSPCFPELFPLEPFTPSFAMMC